MTSISSYYSMLGQESSALWTNQSDQTYGTIGDGYWRYSDANDAYEERTRSTINASPASRGAPNSLQWEFEFGDDAIIYTRGGNDNSSTTNGEDTKRVIFSGKFHYKNNDVKGSLSSITIAEWGNPQQVNGIDEPLSQTEEITAYLPSNASLKINSFDDINQIMTIEIMGDSQLSTGKSDQALRPEEKSSTISHFSKSNGFRTIGTTTHSMKTSYPARQTRSKKASMKTN